MVLDISSAVVAHILAAAAESSDREVCGLLFGTAARVEAAEACRNVAAQPARRFELDPVALLAAHRAARAGGPAIVGHYHSHPSGSAVPSTCDAEAAAKDGAIWLIVAGGELRGWRAVTEGAIHGRFDPVTLRTS
ncbi:Mov34/MPN/PAD-1 family protein [uncultured Sphingomonas sp.]|uniref:Mov34/MPN/PAD-1 family protein n=1 Tax=uncultured Sphingomonas sp. TaxID=158754 RepID=UPI0035C9AF18